MAAGLWQARRFFVESVDAGIRGRYFAEPDDTDIPLLTLFEEPVKGSAARVNEKRRAGREELLAETIAFH